jgi:hypothetical protein
MTFMFKMFHYWQPDAAGNIHVQNSVGGMLGQHHVHTKADFTRWKRKIDKTAIKPLKGTCDCGMSPGQVKEG